ncbi:glycosyltransferase family 87 protein [Actinoplanes sp. HUAS TT8]|uniref:glycosyltransferase family 87 protein n=1 Tax=Actinoplanes sp. HUAS TT8 TaxID=3447453 RepID=UPI003F51E25C
MPVIEKRALRAARTRSALVTVGGLVTLALISIALSRYGLSTLAVTHAAVREWLGGAELYSYREPFTQAGAALPPALAIILAPLALLPLKAAGWILALAGVAALLLSAAALTAPIARRYGRRRAPLALVAAALALFTEPVRAALGEGRPELLLFGLIVADLVALRRAQQPAVMRCAITVPPRRSSSLGFPSLNSPSLDDLLSSHGFIGDPFRSNRSSSWIYEYPAVPLRWPLWRPDDQVVPLRDRLRQGWLDGSWAGVGIGLAAAFAVTPVIFLAGLFVLRRRRAALTALTTCVTATLAGLLFAPRETMTWFGNTLWELNRTESLNAPGNQALAGVLARLYGFPAPPVLVWLSFAALLLAVGLIRARSAIGAGDDVTAFVLIGLAAAAIGPMTTPAELIWLVPALLVLADGALRRRAPTRRPRHARFADTFQAVSAICGYALLLAAPTTLLPWNGYAVALILLTSALPWRPVPPPAARTHPGKRAAAIPVPRASRP